MTGSPHAPPTIVEFHNVSLRFREAPPILEGIDLAISKAELVKIVGPSGSGKTSLLRMAYGDLFPTSGQVTGASYDSLSPDPGAIRRWRRRVSFIFQDYKLLSDRNVFDNVSLPLEAFGFRRKHIRRRVTEALSIVGMASKRNAAPGSLSGGECQRVAIARAIAPYPDLVLADEPTGSLDPETASSIIDLLERINRSGTALLVSSHDPGNVAALPGPVYRITGRRLIEDHGS